MELSGAPFVAFVRDHRPRILAEWERRVRAMPKAASLSRQALLDHLPQLLDEIVAAAEAALRGEPVTGGGKPADQHALVRLDEGYDLGDVVNEYSLLRETIVDLSSAGEQPLVAREVQVFHRVVDDAIGKAVTRFAKASQRTLAALDRISTLVFNVTDVNALLHTLLETMKEASPAIDEVTLLLRDGDRLYVEAAVGFTGERDAGYSLAVGEGFSGTVAATSKPLLLRSAATDPLVKSETFRAHGFKALYGVPLVDGDVIGVVHMGSTSAAEFGDEDLMLFRAMANRATAILVEARLKATLRTQAERLRLVLSTARVGTWELVAATRAFSCDETCRAILGTHTEGPRPLASALEIVDPVDRDRIAAAIETSLRTTEALRVVFRITRPDDGSERHVIARGGVLYDAHGGVERLVGTLIDRTAEHQVENERELFLAALGHDLRNPLNAVSLAAGNLLHHATLDERATRAVQRISSASMRMARLIEQLLDFSRARAGQPFELARRQVDLLELWRAIAEEIELAAPDRRITVDVVGNPLGVWDPDRLSQVFQNLAWNAVQYGDPATPVAVRIDGLESAVTVDVHNAGAPIAPTMLPHIFDPFRRGQRGRGLGLGLYIARHIVAAHDGSITVTSTAEAGTTFRVTLPRA